MIRYESRKYLRKYYFVWGETSLSVIRYVSIYLLMNSYFSTHSLDNEAKIKIMMNQGSKNWKLAISRHSAFMEQHFKFGK